MKIGILALQGSVAEHAQVLHQLGHAPVLVRTAQQMNGLTHLIIPGGESTVMRKLAVLQGIWPLLKNPALQIMGTCAGAILQCELGLDCQIDRNAYGAQAASCVVPLDAPQFADLDGCFIRAPRFARVGDTCTVLARRDGVPVMVQGGRHLALTFHPELLPGETRVHAHFLQM